MLRTIDSFRDPWLENFFRYGKSHKKIPAALENALARKLDILNAATSRRDLRSPPGNMYEELNPPLADYSSIRVNKQYRLIFKWLDGRFVDLWLDTHTYRPH